MAVPPATVRAPSKVNATTSEMDENRVFKRHNKLTNAHNVCKSQYVPIKLKTRQFLSKQFKILQKEEKTLQNILFLVRISKILISYNQI